MYIYLPIHQKYGYLGKKKISLYFPATTCEHFDLHLALYIAIPRGFKQEISPVEDFASTTTTSKQQQFTLNIQF